MNLQDYSFNFGLYLFPRGTPSDESPDVLTLPESIGRIRFLVNSFGMDQDKSVNSDPVNCTDLFDFMNVAENGFSEYAKRAGYCLDPALAEIA